MSSGLRGRDAIGIAVLRVRACRGISRRWLQHWRLLVILVVMGNGSCSRTMRSIRLCGRQMRRMNIHIWLWLIHTADRSGGWIITVADWVSRNGIFGGSGRIQEESALATTH